MQVFKSYWKVLNKNKGQMIMYLGIFMAVLFIFIIPNNSYDGENQYYSMKAEFAVFDYDHSAESEALVSYLEGPHILVEIKEDDTETIQDELFNRNIDCVLRIPEGFSEKLANGEKTGLVEIVTISGTTISMLFETDVNKYLNFVNAYLIAGYDSDAAIEQANHALDQEVEVKLPEKGDTSLVGSRYYYFNYLGWVLVCMMIIGISPIIMVYNQKNLKERIYCSAYPFTRINKEILYGVALTGLGVCALLTIGAMVAFHDVIFTLNGGLFILNMITYMFVALGFAFLVSTLASKVEIVNMYANVISLGMAFLCGIFVPAEFLGKGVITIAHFLPAYWYSQACGKIEHYTSDAMQEILTCMGIELLFAIALVVVGMTISRKKRVEA